MRQIKFRGRMKRTKQWMYGDLAHVQGQPCIQVDVSTDEKKTVGMNVDPDSVGQFTGLYDKNGKEIYEGDIVKLTGKTNETLLCYVDWHKHLCKFYLSFEEEQKVNDTKTDIFEIMRMDYNYEVIGNIHDNPELLLKQEE